MNKNIGEEINYKVKLSPFFFDKIQIRAQATKIQNLVARLQMKANYSFSEARRLLFYIIAFLNANTKRNEKIHCPIAQNR